MAVSGETGRSCSYHWAESVRRLANVELLVISLTLSRGKVVDDRISPNIIHGFVLGYAESLLPNDHADLSLIVEGLSKLLVRKDVISVRNNGSKALGEDDRMGWLVFLVRAVKARLVELFGMLGIILSNAQDISTANRRKQSYT